MKIILEGTPEECARLLKDIGQEAVIHWDTPQYPWWEVKPVWIGGPTITTTGTSNASIKIEK